MILGVFMDKFCLLELFTRLFFLVFSLFLFSGIFRPLEFFFTISFYAKVSTDVKQPDRLNWAQIKNNSNKKVTPKSSLLRCWSFIWTEPFQHVTDFFFSFFRPLTFFSYSFYCCVVLCCRWIREVCQCLKSSVVCLWIRKKGPFSMGQIC